MSIQTTTKALLDEFRSRPTLRAGSLITTVFGDSIAPRGGTLRWLVTGYEAVCEVLKSPGVYSSEAMHGAMTISQADDSEDDGPPPMIITTDPPPSRPAEREQKGPIR